MSRQACGIRSRGFVDRLLWMTLALWALIGCGKQETLVSWASFYPGDSQVAGWHKSGEIEFFDGETIYNLVNGQADSFFAYGFEQVGVQRYENDSGGAVYVQVWQLATPADAYGLYTFSAAGEAAAIGNDGDIEPGLRLGFWQDRYFVQLFGHQPIPEQDVIGFGEIVSQALPLGGERPEIVSALPQEGKLARSELFFHQEISIMSEVWLGGENILGLSQETDGVVAHYDVDDDSALLMLIQYPTGPAATLALKALEDNAVDDLVVVDVRGTVLGAVFGQVERTTVQDMLIQALERQAAR